jgi:hypothetical protein
MGLQDSGGLSLCYNSEGVRLFVGQRRCVLQHNRNAINMSSDLAVAQWIVRMPPKREIQVRFLSAGPKI